MLIGVFHPQDPLGIMVEGRVRAIVQEAIRQGVRLVFFNESGIDLERRTVEGCIFAGDRRVWDTFPFPQAVMNVRPWGPRRRSDRELIFRKMVPFTTFLIDDKWTIIKMMSAVPALSPYLVPTAVLSNVEQVDELLQSHAKLVIKPVQGSRGTGVQALVRQGELYGLQQGESWTWRTREELSEFVQQLEQEHLIQPYIVCLTPAGEPYDFRVLVQRGGEGTWEAAILYPRIGTAGTITSNVSVGGRTEPLEDFLRRLFPDDWRPFPERLSALGLDIAEFIDSRYAHPLDELGIDIAIDAERRMWFYEANACPGTLFYENERAVRAVAYAKYVAVKNSGDPAPAPARVDADVDVGADASAGTGGTGTSAATTLGLLFGSPPSSEYLDAYADVAGSYGVQLVYFFLEGVSFRSGSISGFWRDGRRWVPKTFAFPDVVYNLIEPGTTDAAHPLFRPGSDLLLTSREPKGPVSAPLFFAIAAGHPLLAEHLPRFLRPETPHAAKRFVDHYGSAVMTPDSELRERDVMTIRRLAPYYLVKDTSYLHTFNDTEFSSFLQLFDESDYMLIQQLDSKTHDGHYLHIRVYLFKQLNGAWEVIHIAPLLALSSPDPHGSAPFPASWDWLLDREFNDEEAGHTDAYIRTLACTTAKRLASAYRNRLHEMILDFGIDNTRALQLLGGEINGPGEAVHAYDTARRIIPYALSLLHSRYERAVQR